MMSSCWTLRLKRRNAFSRGSPSCRRTSANLDYTSQLYLLDKCECCSPSEASQVLSYVNPYLVVCSDSCQNPVVSENDWGSWALGSCHRLLVWSHSQGA